MTLIDDYINWLKKKFEQSDVDSWVEVVTPFIDRNNDHIQLYLKEKGSRVLVTDDGSTFANLEFAGFSRTEKRLDILATVFRGFQINWTQDSQIEIACSRDQFPERFHALLQTILSVDSFGYFSEQNVKSMFFEDVAAWLGQNEITYVANKEFVGKSGMGVKFPFQLPHTKGTQLSVIQLVNNPRTSIKPLLFEWMDTEKARGDTRNFTLINDSSIAPPKKAMRAFEEYGVTPIRWSHKDDLLQLIAQ